MVSTNGHRFACDSVVEREARRPCRGDRGWHVTREGEGLEGQALDASQDDAPEAMAGASAARDVSMARAVRCVEEAAAGFEGAVRELGRLLDHQPATGPALGSDAGVAWAADDVDAALASQGRCGAPESRRRRGRAPRYGPQERPAAFPLTIAEPQLALSLLDADAGASLGSRHAASDAWPAQNGSQASRPERQSAPSAVAGDRLYEGTIRLRVVVQRREVKEALQFIHQVCENTALRFLRLVGTQEGSVDLWVKLRAPVPLPEVLREMPGVGHVSAGLSGVATAPGDPCLTVHLRGGLPSTYGRTRAALALR